VTEGWPWFGLAGAQGLPLFAVLSAMVMPVVLISACGSLAISTSNRLSRSIDRVRKLSERFGTLMQAQDASEALTAERQHVYDQLAQATRRARLLQRAMSRLYIANSLFVATSLAIAATALFGTAIAVLPVATGLLGALLLFNTSLLLSVESRLTLGSIDAEMDYVARVGRQLAPEDWLRVPRPAHWRFPRWRWPR
jgi:hypothetical protein